MLKSFYDLDCTTWSPQGKLFQIEYAMEAVKQGSVCLGLRSSEYVVLCSLKRLPSELAGYQEKMFKVDDYIGMAMSGLTADARVLCKYMRNECMNYKLTYGSNQPINRLLFKVAESTHTFLSHRVTEENSKCV
jgi:20S proteasome subunit alpha 6